MIREGWERGAEKREILGGGKAKSPTWVHWERKRAKVGMDSTEEESPVTEK